MLLLYERSGGGAEAPEPGRVAVPDLSAAGPEGRAARTALALREATTAGGWTLLDHPLITLDVAGSPAYLEPDAVVVHPDGGWTVVEIKSFPMIDGSADPAKVGAAARQAAVYVLALERVAAQVLASTGRTVTVRDQVLLVCPKDFANLPTAEAVDIRKQLATTRRQLQRLTKVEEIAGQLPPGTTFDLRLADDGKTVTRSAAELAEAVESVDAAYAPECLSTCELAFHCREQARAAGAVESLGRGVRGELGGLRTVEEVLAAARTESAADDATGGSAGAAATACAPDTNAGAGADTDAPAAEALRRAAALRAEALAGAGAGGARDTTSRSVGRADGAEGVPACR